MCLRGFFLRPFSKNEIFLRAQKAKDMKNKNMKIENTKEQRCAPTSKHFYSQIDTTTTIYCY
jgi:hypothetical protein